MQDIGKFVAWVKTKGGQRGLAAAFLKKFPKEKPLSQTAISNWVTRRTIPVERRAQLEILGWHGPWDWPQEAAQAVAEPAPAYITREDAARDYGRLEGRIEALEKAFERLAEGFRRHLEKEPGEAHPQEPA